MIISRYVIKQIYEMMSGVFLVLLLIIFSSQFLHYLKHALGQHLFMPMILKLTLIQVPAVSGYLLPLCFFLGVLLTYTRLWADSEMVILMSSGIGYLKLIWIPLKAALSVAFLVSVLVFWIQPKLFGYQGRLIYEAKEKLALQLVPPGVFQNINKQWVLYAETIDRAHRKMKNLFVAYTPERAHAPWHILLAKEAEQVSGEPSSIFLKEGVEYTGIPGEGVYHRVHFRTMRLKLDPAKWSQDLLSRHQNYLPTMMLWQQRKNKKAMAELHMRLSMPICVFILALLALPLSQIRHRHFKQANVLPAMLLYVIYMNLLLIGRMWIKKGVLPAFLGLWWVHGLFLLITFMLCLRVHWPSMVWFPFRWRGSDLK